MKQDVEQKCVARDIKWLIVYIVGMVGILMPSGFLALELRDYFWHQQPMDIVNLAIVVPMLICGIILTFIVAFGLRTKMKVKE